MNNDTLRDFESTAGLSEARVMELLATCTEHPPARLPPGWLAFARAIEREARASAGPDAELTAKQIEQGWHDTFSTSNPFCPCTLQTFTKAARWAERTIRRTTREAPAAAPVLTDDMLRYAMAAIGTGSPHDAERFRAFWLFASEAALTATTPQAAAPAVGLQPIFDTRVTDIDGNDIPRPAAPAPAEPHLTFGSLAEGQRFKFFPDGALLTKTGRRSYDNPAFGQRGLSVSDINQSVIHDATPPPQAAAPADEMDPDRVFSMADVHAIESCEDGRRIFERGGLLAFASDIARKAPAPDVRAALSAVPASHVEPAGQQEGSAS